MVRKIMNNINITKYIFYNLIIKILILLLFYSNALYILLLIYFYIYNLILTQTIFKYLKNNINIIYSNILKIKIK